MRAWSLCVLPEHAHLRNHGLAVAYAAKLERIDLTLFLPENASAIKREKIEATGIRPEFFGRDCEKTEIHARAVASERGRVFISPYNDADVIAGQGTTAVEIIDALSGLEAVIVPVGGGGLIAGIAGTIKSFFPGVRVFGVEPEVSAFMKASIDAGQLVGFPERPSVADGVAGGIEPGSMTFPLCRGALAVAGLLAAPERFQGQRVVCVSSGSNIDRRDFIAIARP